jgi:hypothetical protein
MKGAKSIPHLTCLLLQSRYWLYLKIIWEIDPAEGICRTVTAAINPLALQSKNN